MESVNGGRRALAVLALVALAYIALRYGFGYPSAKDAFAGAAVAPHAVAPQLAPAVAHPAKQLAVSLQLQAVRHLRTPTAVDAYAAIVPVASVAAVTRARPAPQQSVALPPLPYTHAGFFEADGARMAVLARGDLLLLKNRGERVDNEFQLATVDPPALLHLPTGTLLQVPPQIAEAPVWRPAAGVAPPLSARPMASNAVPPPAFIDSINAAEIEAEIAVALATPLPEPIVQSSFPLAR